MQSREQRQRLVKLASVLETMTLIGIQGGDFVYPEERGLGLRINGPEGPMQLYFNMVDIETERACGTVCCALGLGAILEGVVNRRSNNFSHFNWSTDVYGLDNDGFDDYSWLFHGSWASVSDHRAREPVAAAHRIYYYLVNGAHSAGWAIDWDTFVTEHPFEETKAAALALASGKETV